MDESVCTQCEAPVEDGLIFCKKCGATLRPPIPLVAPTEKSAHADVPAYADAIALGIVAVELTILFWWLVPDDGTRLIAGIIAYGVLVSLALSMWHGKHAARFSDARDWAKLFVGSILIGALFFGIDMIVGSINHPGKSPFVAGTKAGSPFGFIFTIFVCPGLTMVATAGFVRSLIIRHKSGA